MFAIFEAWLRTYKQNALFDDSGTNHQWRERMPGPFVRHAAIRVPRATVVLARKIDVAGVSGDGLYWPYRLD